MLSPRLTNIAAGTSIPALLASIDRKLMELANDLYNNVVFSLNNKINSEEINDLLNYKRILRYKYCNPDYASPFTVQMIASKIALYSPYNCSCSKFNIVYGESTTTTTTSNPSTTSSTTTVTPTIVSICLTYASTGGCAASCGLDCSTYYTDSACANYINTNAAPQPLGCIIYTDPQGTILAPNGFYSRPTGLCYIIGNGGGAISGITLCP